MRNLFFAFAILTLASSSLQAQDYPTKFAEVFKAGDSTATVQLLTTWKKQHPNDPELYVAYYNYYASKAVTEGVALQTSKPNGKIITLTDSNGREAGYLGSQIFINTYYLKKATNCIDEAIAKYPKRLDMRFGKCYLLERTQNYAAMATTLVNTLNYGSKIKFAWQWKNSEPLDDAPASMLSSLQTYMEHIFNSGEENIKYIKPVAQTALKYFPDNVENLSNLAVTYIIDKDYNKALSYLLHAEKKARTDQVILSNIAYCYLMLKDNANAIKYYRLCYQYGDDATRANALKFLNKLGE